MKQTLNKQSGFTLVEIAIVLVIIGVLLAGVLKGQSMITNSRIKGLVNNMNAVSSSYNGYIDRYQANPGSEAVAILTARGWATTAAVPAVYALPLASTLNVAGAPAASSQPSMWQVLKAAGFFAGNQTDLINPPNAVGGLIGVSSSPYALPGTSVCISSVTGTQAEGVDIIVDGPLPPAPAFGNDSGSLQGASAAPGAVLEPTVAIPAGAAYSETSANTWTLCRTL